MNKEIKVTCFSHCVAAGKCNPRAHGGITVIIMRTDSAVRAENRNGKYVEASAWAPAGAHVYGTFADWSEK